MSTIEPVSEMNPPAMEKYIIFLLKEAVYIPVALTLRRDLWFGRNDELNHMDVHEGKIRGYLVKFNFAFKINGEEWVESLPKVNNLLLAKLKLLKHQKETCLEAWRMGVHDHVMKLLFPAITMQVIKVMSLVCHWYVKRMSMVCHVCVKINSLTCTHMTVMSNFIQIHITNWSITLQVPLTLPYIFSSRQIHKP